MLNQQNTVLQRLTFWKSTIKIIGDFTFQGVGAGNLGNIYPRYRELVANETMFTHNIFLQTWAETGLVGLGCIVLLFFIFIKKSLRVEKNFINIGIIASLYVFIVNNLIDFSFFIPQVSFLWWMSMGILVREKNTDEKKVLRAHKYAATALILLVIFMSTRSLAALNYYQRGSYRNAIALEPYNDIYHAAIKDYPAAIKLNPFSPFYHKKLGMLYLEKNMFKEALSEFEIASSLYPANESLRQRLFDLYKKTGQDEKAEKEQAWLKEFRSRYSGYFIR